MIILLTKFSTKNSSASDQLAAMLKDLAQSTALETGNLSYQAFSLPTEHLIHFVIETWEKKEFVDFHAERVKQEGYLQKSIALLAEPMDTQVLLQN